jgi:hypothetical protein
LSLAAITKSTHPLRMTICCWLRRKLMQECGRSFLRGDYTTLIFWDRRGGADRFGKIADTAKASRERRTPYRFWVTNDRAPILELRLFRLRHNAGARGTGFLGIGDAVKAALKRRTPCQREKTAPWGQALPFQLWGHVRDSKLKPGLLSVSWKVSSIFRVPVLVSRLSK